MTGVSPLASVSPRASLGAGRDDRGLHDRPRRRRDRRSFDGRLALRHWIPDVAGSGPPARDRGGRADPHALGALRRIVLRAPVARRTRCPHPGRLRRRHEPPGRKRIGHRGRLPARRLRADPFERPHREEHGRRGLRVAFSRVQLTNDPLPPSVVECGVTIKEMAVVGTAALLLPGVTIGAGAFVAAGSVVRADVPPVHCVAGDPATVFATLEQLVHPEHGLSYPWPKHFRRGYPEEQHPAGHGRRRATRRGAHRLRARGTKTEPACPDGLSGPVNDGFRIRRERSAGASSTSRGRDASSCCRVPWADRSS